ncbi:hypothetical protein GCM10010401_12020 [Rarobacter faecitabidus]|uniref:Substrate-binding family protein n=1 Tax=Rarobacter faecitabidus TaxID=13243 RepID=A0A542ZPC1_RARFA|nr:hypothetical protein [Rarobacter faecitabidus]TQL62060.1 hypothetical protein FB461_1693 [Rarobacter faecitabidus]
MKYRHGLRFFAAVIAVGLALAGCSSADKGAPGGPASAGSGAVAAPDGGTSPPAAHSSTAGNEPGTPASWYLIAPAADQPFVTSLGDALSALARDSGAVLTVLRADDASGLSDSVTAAVAAGPQLIIGATPAAQEEISFTAAENLAQQFLLIDGQPPEPTENLTTLLFDQSGCPAGAACVTRADIFDPEILTENNAFDLTEALETALVQVAERPGTILLSAVEYTG